MTVRTEVYSRIQKNANSQLLAYPFNRQGHDLHSPIYVITILLIQEFTRVTFQLPCWTLSDLQKYGWTFLLFSRRLSQKHACALHRHNVAADMTFVPCHYAGLFALPR